MSIASAIQNGQLLSFLYDNENRTVEPHTCGITKTGKESVRAYQVRGGSQSGKSEGFKIFEIRKMSRLSELQEHFVEPRPGYTRNDSAFQTIHAEL